MHPNLHLNSTVEPCMGELLFSRDHELHYLFSAELTSLPTSSIQPWTSRVNVKFDSPPSPSACLARRIAACVHSRSTLPPSESISHLTFAATSSASTTSLSYSSTATARPSSFYRNTLFIRCSAYSGQASMGTPAMITSSTEFHPQCVTKPPTAPCASTSRCGAHDLTTRPVPLVRSRKPSGRRASRSGTARPIGTSCRWPPGRWPPA